MITRTESLNELLTLITGMASASESDRVKDAMRLYQEYASDEDYQIARKALSDRLKQLANAFEADLNDTADVMRLNGMTYALDNWLTVADYARKYGVDTHVVTNWIRRGTIPETDVLTLTRINNTRMVKDRAYR